MNDLSLPQMSFSLSAATKVKRLIKEEDNKDLKLRVFVTGEVAQVLNMVLHSTRTSRKMIPVLQKLVLCCSLTH